MNPFANRTYYRETPAGIIAVRGSRELHMLGTSLSQIAKSRAVLAGNSFDSLFKAAKSSPAGRGVRYLKVTS